MKYRSEIDGLRSVAVVPVILFHLGFAWIDGGYIGVDVFFVISGFLITAIILREFEHDCFTFKAFWARRVRRILPALIVMLAATVSVLTLFSFRGDSSRLGFQGIAAVLSFSNIALWRNTGNYWGATAQDSPFLHTWSLSVEEQFYFIYPVFVLVILRFARRWLLPALLTATVTSFILYLIGSNYKPTATFYLLPTRAWELGCGCLLAIWRGQKGEISGGGRAQAFDDILAILGLSAILASYFVFSANKSFAGYLAIPVLGTSLFIGFANRNNVVGRFLSLSPLVFVGKMSYSLYLWHWPVIVLAPSCFHTAKWAARTDFRLLLMTAVAFLSYKFVESPTRHASLKSKRFLCCIALVIVTLSISWHINSRSPYYDISQYSLVIWEGQSYVAAPIDAWAEWDEKMTQGIQASWRDPEASFAWANGGIIKQHGTDVPEIVLLGDSHALMWAGTIDQIARRLKKTTSFYAAHGTSPFVTIPVQKTGATVSFSVNERYTYDMNRIKYLSEWKPKVVVLSVRWSSYGESRPPNELIEFLGNNGVTVILIQQPPELFFGDRNTLQFLSYLGILPKNGKRQTLNANLNDAKYRSGQMYVRELCAKYKFCRAVEVEEEYRDATTGDVYVLDGADVLYIDDDHLSQCGAEKLLPKIERAIESVFR